MLKLIGMMDSPYVRRVAIAMSHLGIEFSHEPVSVLREFERFARINPVVKAPTLICEDGTVLMDSSLILRYAEHISPQAPGRLYAADTKTLQDTLRGVGLALTACEKSVQLVYERDLRPVRFRYEPWIERVTAQLRAAYNALEAELADSRELYTAAELNPANIAAAVAWTFTTSTLPELNLQAAYARLPALSEAMERRPEFLRFPPV